MSHRTLVNETVAKYKSSGWVVHVSKTKCINDMIAINGTNLHFIKIADTTCSDQEKNDFIQNAYSNNALPILIQVTLRYSADNVKQTPIIKATNAERHSNVIITRNTKKKAPITTPAAPRKPATK